MLDMTTVAAHPHETVLQATAFQEVVKLPLDVGRKFLTLRFHQVTELVQKLLISPLGPLFARLYSYKKLQKTFAHICAKALSDEELQGFWTLISQQQGLRVFHKLIRYMSERRQFRERWVGALQNTSVPLALINGSADPISGAHMVARYRELVGGENIVQLPGIGHYPQLEDSQTVLAAVQSFLAGVMSSG